MNTKKLLLIALSATLLALSPGKLAAQCNILLDSAIYNGQTYFNPDTIQICLGESVSFYSHGGCPTYLMANDFDNGTVGSGWNSNASPMFNNPCGVGPNGTTYLWIGPATTFPRQLTTNAFAVTTQCQICFDMKYASQANSTPCEGPDESTEGVHLQWSNNPGGPWLDINYWDPVGGYDPYLTTWHQYCENIPVNGNIYFRWYQDVTSGNDYDHWGLDNVQIFCPPVSQTTTISTGAGVVSTGQWNATVTPTQSTTYYVTVSDGTLSATDSIYISVYPPPTVTISGLAAGYCSTDPAVTLTGTPTPGDFSGPGIVPPNTFDPSVAGPGTHTITYHHYYVATNPSTGVFNIFTDDFSTDKGWTGYGSGGWARGSATASTGCSTSQDPAQDHTPTADNFLIGNYIGACYPNNMAQTYWLTSPIINCSNQNNCVLEFWSFSGCESSNFDHMYVDVYNGTAWQNVYTNTASFAETAWTLRTYTVPQATNNANFRVRFGLGSTDGSVTYMGWNVDDLAVKCAGTIMVTDTLCDFTTTQNVTIAPQPTSTFTVVSPVCINSPTSITYTGNAPANATFNWNFGGGTVHSGSGAGPYSVSWAVDNTYDITLTVTVGGCASQQTTQQVVVLPFSDPLCCQPPSPFAGNDAQVCSNTYTLQATPSTLNGYWTSVSAGPQLGSAMNPICNVQVSTFGSYQFVYHESTGPGCDNTDTVTVLFTQQPVAEAGPTFSICNYTNTLNATPSVGTGTWTCNNPLVTFGNLNLPNSSVTVPADGQYTFTWTEDNGNGCISSDIIVGNFAQQPNANAGSDNAVCQLSYTLQATPSVGTGTWSLIPGSGSANFQNNHAPITSVDVNLTGTYNFIWTENNGLGCVDADTVQIQMTLTPNSNFTTTNIACYGDYSTITYTGNGTAQCTYTWNFSNGNVNPGTGPGPHTITWGAENTYTVTLQVSLNGCNSTTSSQQIIVPPALQASIQGIDLPCFGAPTGEVHLTVSGGTPVSGGNYYYLWNNGYLSEDLTDMPMGFYAVTVTDAHGCTITQSTYINQPPQLSLLVTPSHIICPGETTQLTIHPVGGSFPYEYFWNGALSGPTITVTPSQNTTYSAYVKDSHGCQSHTASTTVSIHPPMQLIASANTDSICPAEPVLISFTASQGAGAPYVVTGSDGNIISSPYLYYPPYSTSYVVTATDVCNQTAIVEIPLFVYPLPPNAFLPDSVNGCQPFTVHFNEISPDFGQTYVWDFGDNTNLSLAKNPTHTFQSPGVFDITLTVTSVDGCKTVNVVDSLITVNPTPNALFTYDPSIVSVLKPLVSFNNLSTWGYEYIWSFGTGDSSSLQHPVYRFPDVGTYPIGLIVISEFGCRDTAYASIMVRDEVTFYAPTAFSPDNDGTNDIFYVSGHGIDPATFYLAIYDRFGQIIWETSKWDPHNPEMYGWNGKHKSKNIVPIGTYTWICTFNDFRGGLYEKAGTVTVIW